MLAGEFCVVNREFSDFQCLMNSYIFLSSYDLVSLKHGLQTADYGLWTGYKTRTRYKTRTTDCVYKNSFRKVKLRERDSGLA